MCKQEPFQPVKKCFRAQGVTLTQHHAPRPNRESLYVTLLHFTSSTRPPLTEDLPARSSCMNRMQTARSSCTFACSGRRGRRRVGWGLGGGKKRTHCSLGAVTSSLSLPPAPSADCRLSADTERRGGRLEMLLLTHCWPDTITEGSTDSFSQHSESSARRLDCCVTS